jgi:plasmid maintenance system antidote protein VapI
MTEEQGSYVSFIEEQIQTVIDAYSDEWKGDRESLVAVGVQGGLQGIHYNESVGISGDYSLEDVVRMFAARSILYTIQSKNRDFRLLVNHYYGHEVRSLYRGNPIFDDKIPDVLEEKSTDVFVSDIVSVFLIEYVSNYDIPIKDIEYEMIKFFLRQDPMDWVNHYAVQALDTLDEYSSKFGIGWNLSFEDWYAVAKNRNDGRTYEKPNFDHYVQRVKRKRKLLLDLSYAVDDDAVLSNSVKVVSIRPITEFTDKNKKLYERYFVKAIPVAQQIIEYALAHPGLTQKKIAEEFGVGQTHVSAVLKKAGVKSVGARKPKISREEQMMRLPKELLTTYREQGLTTAEIAEMVDLGPQQVSWLVNHYGISKK